MSSPHPTATGRTTGSMLEKSICGRRFCPARCAGCQSSVIREFQKPVLPIQMTILRPHPQPRRHPVVASSDPFPTTTQTASPWNQTARKGICVVRCRGCQYQKPVVLLQMTILRHHVLSSSDSFLTANQTLTSWTDIARRGSARVRHRDLHRLDLSRREWETNQGGSHFKFAELQTNSADPSLIVAPGKPF